MYFFFKSVNYKGNISGCVSNPEYFLFSLFTNVYLMFKLFSNSILINIKTIFLFALSLLVAAGSL